MTAPDVTVKQLVDLARKNIEDQQCRIVRQRELMAKYERDDDVARRSAARRVLQGMQKLLAQMTAAHADLRHIVCQRDDIYRPLCVGLMLQKLEH